METQGQSRDRKKTKGGKSVPAGTFTFTDFAFSQQGRGDDGGHFPFLAQGHYPLRVTTATISVPGFPKIG